MDHKKSAKRPANGRRIGKKKIIALLALLLLGMAVGGTLAYLVTKSAGLVNTFQPVSVTTTVTEDFDGTVKKNVNATNTGEVDAYLRVALVTYRVDENGNRIGGLAEIPEFDPGEGWIAYNGFYYYTSPVKPSQQPPAKLIGEPGITLKTYDDADGGKQVIEVMAEAIQAEGVNASDTPAVTDAWGMIVGAGGVLTAPATAG